MITKPIHFARHARNRMRLHKISLEQVVAVIQQPDSVAPTTKDRYNAFGRIEERFLRVTCKEEEMRLVVVTVTPRKRPFKGDAGEN